MTVTITVKNEYDFLGTDYDGNLCIFPRDFRNQVTIAAFDYRTRKIYGDGIKYCAFPFLVEVGGSYIAIFSEGDSHGASNRQKMVRSDTGDFSDARFVTFYENTTGTYNFSLLDGTDSVFNTSLLGVGEAVKLKTFTVKNTAGVFGVTIQTTVSDGTLTYNLWSKPRLNGSTYYCTAYNVTGLIGKVALCSSPDLITWTFEHLIFDGTSTSRLYTECDIVNTSGNNWLAIVREDIEEGNRVYQATCTDDLGGTWSAASLTDFSGRQPNLEKLADDSIIASFGDRSDTSGISASGTVLSSTGGNTTGIAIYRSVDDGVTWSFRTRVLPTYSTDGGQPFIAEISAGRIFIICYIRLSLNEEPKIWSCLLDVENL